MKTKILKFSLLVSLYTFLCTIAFAQEIKFNQFTAGNGLSNNFVNCLLQDKTGFIWFGTDDGLNRFDGYEIKVYRNNPDDKYSLSGNIIWALCEDHQGNLWIGTKTGGLNKYSPDSDKFKYWKLETDSLEEINITSIFEDSRKYIWIGTYKNGLYRFNPLTEEFDHWYNTNYDKNIISSNFITSIIEDQNSDIWISTYNGIDKIIFSQSGKPNPQLIKESPTPIWYLKTSTLFENMILVGSLNGLQKFDPVSGVFTQIQLPTSDGLQFGQSVSSVAEQSFNNEKILWVGTYGGLVYLNLTTGHNERYIQGETEKSELISNQIHDIIIDRSGVVWIAGENGLNFYSQKRAKFNLISSVNSIFSNTDKLFNMNIRAIAYTDNKSYWFGTDAGLYEIKNKKNNSSITNNPSLTSLNVWSLFYGSSDKLWIGTYGQGLKELDIKTNKLKSWKVDNPDFKTASFNYVKTIAEDKEGNIWIGFWGAGLARLNPADGHLDHWRKENISSTGLSYNDIWAIIKDKKGRIWIGTNGGGLDLYQGENQNNFYNWNANENRKQKLSSNSIFTVFESVQGNKKDDQTILWIGTANGLNKFFIKDDSGNKDGAKLNVEIKSYTVKDGLPDNTIESIFEDENGNLWIGTSSGISFFNTLTEKFANYSAADGLKRSTFNSNSVIKTAEGILIFGCASGLNYFDPKRITQSSYSSPVVITDFQIHNQPENHNNNSELIAGIYNSKSVELLYNQNDFSFQFASLDYNAPDRNEYAYFMEGFDRDWNYSGKRRFVTYTNLDPGEYVFQVKATNSDGMWSNDIAKIFIVIKPPFWKTWWAYTVYVIAFFGLLYFIRKTEIRRRKRKEEERLRREREEARLREAELKAINIEQEKELEKQKIRNRIAQDLHDEIGSNLSSISLMSELIQNDEKINKEASEKIKRIHSVAKGSTQAIRDIVWLTNPSSDSLKDLIVKMKEVADNSSGKFNLNFDYPQEIPDINLLPETKRNIFFIYKEVMNNIIKHSGAKNVNIRFKIEDYNMLLSIKDDGKGFNINDSFNGNGIKNIKSRAKEINAELKFESSPGNGTILELFSSITQMRD